MITTCPLSRPIFPKPDPWTTGHGRIPAAYLAPIFGGDPGGYHNYGDTRVSKTLDGVHINKLWDEFGSALSVLNEKRSKLASLVSTRRPQSPTPSSKRPEA